MVHYYPITSLRAARHHVSRRRASITPTGITALADYCAEHALDRCRLAQLHLRLADAALRRAEVRAAQDGGIYNHARDRLEEEDR